MTTEFDLSEKIEGQMKTIGKSIPLEDVKEFIRLLKEEIASTHGAGCTALKFIDKLSGDKLNAKN